MVIFALCVLVVMGDVPVLRVGACQSDDDCVISTHSGCCDCCGVPRAVTRANLAPQDCSTQNCGVVPCDALRCKPNPDPSTLRAVCRAGTCRAEPRQAKTKAAFCAIDSDCVISSFSCCQACCPVQPWATTPAELEAMRSRCATTICPMIRCAPEQCKALSPPGAPTCRNNRCELTKTTPAECRSDDDCTVSSSAPSADDHCHRGVCAPRQPESRPGKVTPLTKTPPFGLSQPTAPQCSPCTSPTPFKSTWQPEQPGSMPRSHESRVCWCAER